MCVVKGLGIVARLLLGIGVSLTFLAGTVSHAQTSTPPPSPTPDVRQMWTLPPEVNAQGTPYPAQDVVFAYSVNAGEAAIALFLGVLILLVMAGLVIYLLSLNKDSKANHGGRITPAAPAPFDRRLAPRERRDL